ncbi:uncharacterized protein LOC142598026 [Dermatophagoides farinae]|uniref:uncharacterized protein LOC142598026 n=1 Tax=Dermatophagoides farinae TaxID=6954 RepID=UPI003F5E3D03
MLKIQETPDSLPDGQTPQTIFAFVYDHLIDSIRAGDYIQITGIYRALPVRKSIKQRTIRSIFRCGIDVLDVVIQSNTSYEDDASLEEFEEVLADELSTSKYTNYIFKTDEQDFQPSFVVRANEFAKHENVYENLVAAFAPEIWEYQDIKKGLLCLLFGGNTSYLSEGKSCVRTRGDIHVLLCGDPSTAKSQLLKYVHQIAPRGVYCVGRGTSSAGLTASVTKDPESNEYVLEAGAVVLSDKGICCIDEFDKMSENTRTILHEVMEQQTVSITKAGIVCSLNTRVAILASANPIKSKYDARKSVVENINMVSTLLSRFDLIYLMLDISNPEQDRKIANHICELYTKKNEYNDKFSETRKHVNIKFLKNYIRYAKAICNPIIEPEIENVLIETYLKLRGYGSAKTLMGTPRQLDSLIRIATALAKMELSSVVKKEHIDEAARLLTVATYATLTDPVTGKIDFDQLNIGVGEAARTRQSILERVLLKILNDLPEGLPLVDIEEKMNQELKEQRHKLLSPKEFQTLINFAINTGLIGRVGAINYISLMKI